MCFSAAASFTSSAIISSVGVAGEKRPIRPSQRVFASIPLVFGFQQLIEGILWVTLRSGKYPQLQDVSAHVYLIVALMAWPVIVPVAMYLMEDVASKKRIISIFLVMGMIVSLYSAYCLLFYQVTPQIQGFHIVYITNFPNVGGDASFLMYLASTDIFPIRLLGKTYVANGYLDHRVSSCYQRVLRSLSNIGLVLLRRCNKCNGLLDT